MVNPGSFKGARKEFLLAQKADYAASVVGGYTADCLADIQRRYFKRFPIEHEHNVDPPREWLDSIDDNAIDPEPVPPDEDSIADAEFEALQREWMGRRKAIIARKEVRVRVHHVL